MGDADRPRPPFYAAATVLFVSATVAGTPAPLFVRCAGLALAVPALILFILTAPRSTR